MHATSFKMFNITAEDRYELPTNMRIRSAVIQPSRHIELIPEPKPSSVSPPMFIATDVGSRFGARLRDIRRSHKLTQLDMGISFGIDRSYISDVECGKKGISLATLEVIALSFSMKLSDLFEDL